MWKKDFILWTNNVLGHIWHHQHLLEDVPGGTWWRILYDYKARWSPKQTGQPDVLLKRQLSQIFFTGHQAVEKLFNSAGV